MVSGFHEQNGMTFRMGCIFCGQICPAIFEASGSDS